MIREDIQGANTHVYLESKNYVDWIAFDEGISGRFHASKEVLEGIIPFGGDIVNKKWSFGEEYSYHLLLFQQVNPF